MQHNRQLFLAALFFFASSSILLASGETFYTVCKGDDVYYPYLVLLDTDTRSTSIVGNLDPSTTSLIYPPEYCGRPAFGMHVHCDGSLYFAFSDTEEYSEFSYYNWGTLVRRFDVPYPNGKGWNFNAGYTDKFFQHGFYSGFTGDCNNNLLTLRDWDGGYYAMNFQTNSEFSRDVYSSLSYGSLAYNYKSSVLVGMNVNDEYAWYPTDITTPAAFVYYLDPNQLTTKVEARSIPDSASFFRDYDNFEISNDGTLGYMLVDTGLYVPEDGETRQKRGDCGGRRGESADSPSVNSMKVWYLGNVSVVDTIVFDGPFQECYGLTKANNPCSSCAGFLHRPAVNVGKREPTQPEPVAAAPLSQSTLLSEAIPLARSQ